MERRPPRCLRIGQVLMPICTHLSHTRREGSNRARTRGLHALWLKAPHRWSQRVSDAAKGGLRGKQGAKSFFYLARTGPAGIAAERPSRARTRQSIRSGMRRAATMSRPEQARQESNLQPPVLERTPTNAGVAAFVDSQGLSSGPATPASLDNACVGTNPGTEEWC